MYEDNADGYFLRVLDSSVAAHLSRMALVAERGRQSFVLQEVRNQVPTYIVSSIGEMRAAMNGQDTLFALDMREMSIEDTALLALCLGESRQALAAVYILSAEQFSLFDTDTFQFVYS